MANDTTKTTPTFSIEYPADGYDAAPTWAELYGTAFEDIDSLLADRLTEEEVEDSVDALLTGGDKVSLSYDDANDALQIDTSALDAEEVRDEVGSLLVGGDGINVAVDDDADTVTLSLASHAATHEKGGSDELTTFGDTTHDSVSTDEEEITRQHIINTDEYSTFLPRSHERSGPPTVRPMFGANNPVLAASDVNNWSSADFVADGQWQRLSDGYIHILCEVSDGAGDTRIGHAKSPNGINNWTGGSSGSAGIDVILDSTDFGYDFALPWFRNIGGTIRMVPSTGDGQIHLLSISESDFIDDPATGWSETEVISSDSVHSDPIPVFAPMDDRWYIFYKDTNNNDHRAKYAESQGRELVGNAWSTVSWNPISTSNKYRRPAGRAGI